MRMQHLARPADLCREGLGTGYKSESLWGDRLLFPRNYEERAGLFHSVAQLCRETPSRPEGANELL